MNVYLYQNNTEKEVKNIYIGEYKPINTAGIYHNSDLGLISLSSDGTHRTTIADKNLGATSTNLTNISSYGNYYQWRNNWGFSNSGGDTTQSKQENASTYGPNNYYSNATFITTNPRDSSNNSNLWGETTNTSVARKGPCSAGFHIPSNSELTALYNLGITLGAWTSSDGTNFRGYTLLPLSGYKHSNGNINRQGTNAYITTSTPASNNNNYYAQADTSITLGNIGKSYGLPIRPFKNESVQPTEDWTVLYQPN